MINAGFVDFLFTGVAVVPEVLLLAGYAGPALLLFIPLLIAACLVGMYRQQVAPPQTGDEAAGDPGLPPDAVGCAQERPQI